MPDRFELGGRSRTVPPLPSDFQDWKGFRLPVAQSFEWTGLARIAWANGFVLNHDLLMKWRRWRFLPAPVAGGKRVSGPGKRQTWSRQAGLRVAWIATWQLQSLTYDALRVAMWPWTPELEKERAADLKRSLRRFVEQDRDFTNRKLLNDKSLEEDEIAHAYEDVVVLGESSRTQREQLAIDAGLDAAHAGFEATVELIEHLNFEELLVTCAETTDSELAEFMRTFRSRVVPHHLLADDLWFQPLGVARIVIRELHAAALRRRGRLASPPPTTS